MVHKRTKLERRLILLTMLISLISLALIAAIVAITYGRKEEHVCSTPGCINAASNLLKRIDQSVDPCDDFYEFVCGNYIKTTNIPEDKISVDSFGECSDIVSSQLKSIIDDPLPKQSPKPYKIIKDIYNLCMNLTAIEENGVEIVKNYFKELGGWPLLHGENWNNDGTFDWKTSMYASSKLGFSTSYFLSLNIGLDPKNSTRFALKLDQASLGLDRAYLVKGFEEKLVEAYYEYMVDISVLLGADKTDALEELKETVEFEIELAKIILPDEESRNSTAFYNPMTIKELSEAYPNIPWLEYANGVLNIPNSRILEDDLVIVAVPKFIDHLEALLQRTPERVQANYLMRRHALTTIKYLPNAFRDRQSEYYKILIGQGERAPRWKECTRIATGSVWFASGAAYVRKYFEPNTKMHAVEIVADIKAEFIKTLKNCDWMDEITRKNALEKAEAITPYIAYSDELLDEEKIENVLDNMNFAPDSYIKAMKSVFLFYDDFYNSKFREPVNKSDWTERSNPTSVNAYYSSSENSIEFPAAVLQGIFFDANRPRYMNYGAIGCGIGHEITHGFDDMGRQYDKNGNLNDWWGETTAETFVKKAQCIIDQYGNFTVEEVNLNLNGINTQAENIADNGAVKIAYLAYQSWVKRNAREGKLPGLKYTPNQLFWISAANVWCSKERKEALTMQIKTGGHSPNKFRILGPFGNSEYFAKDFNCPIGSKMNPIHKCKVW